MAPKDPIEAVRLGLSGGDRRSKGAADAYARNATQDGTVRKALVAALGDSDPVVRLRAADALEKVSRTHAHMVQRHLPALMETLVHQPQDEVRWHMLQLLPRLRLNAEDRACLAAVAWNDLDSASAIVRASAMTALDRLSQDDPQMQARWRPRLEGLLAAPSPAVRTRARKLLAGSLRAP